MELGKETICFFFSLPNKLAIHQKKNKTRKYNRIQKHYNNIEHTKSRPELNSVSLRQLRPAKRI